VLQGLAAEETMAVVHGSTVATNALLERRGARTALIVTRGFADILEIRRQTRPAIYDLEPRRPPHAVQRELVVEVDERMAPDGTVVRPLSGTDVAAAVDFVRETGAEAAAVCLLYGFRDTAHELHVVGALREAGIEACASHEIFPEHREYERASTTAINAFLRPGVRGYLERLSDAVPGLRVIQSSGGLAPVAQAGSLPVSMVTSGPAGGVLGALAVARAAGFEDVITFDMGGTSTDVSLCPDGQPQHRTASEIDGMAVHHPTIDIVTVGAGGGSIAHLDPAGALRVGPESAGADPGPACYGKGDLPAVSDANAVLGRLRPEQRLAGWLGLDLKRAQTALATLGPAEEAARSVIAVVNANMAGALRRVSLERGFDPAMFTLVAFGGAGPLHACELAAEVGIGRVLIPRHPGVLSALGMVAAPLAVERSLPVTSDLDAALASRLRHDLDDAAGAAGWTSAERAAAHLGWFVDARYRGQGHELRVPLDSPPETAQTAEAAFHAQYERRFGYGDRTRPVEIVNLRARLESPGLAPPLLTRRPGQAPPGHTVIVDGAPASLFNRDALSPGVRIEGPAVVIQDDATTFLPAGWLGEVDMFDNILARPLPQ
jgi:N-methylhydantoinase A